MVSKLAFVHRRLWQTDGLYRLSVFFGPAPLLGALIAGGLWFSLQLAPQAGRAVPEWAKPDASSNWILGGKPQPVAPSAKLPPQDGNRLQGFDTGWHAQTRPVRLLPTLNVEVEARPLAAYKGEGSTFDMSLITANAPGDTAADPIYVGVAGGFFVAPEAGEYALALRLERPAGRRANCLERLFFGPRQVLSGFDIGLVDDVSKTSRQANFLLEPGLYQLKWVFGCWDGRSESQQGRITIMVSHPGETTLRPMGAWEVVFPSK